MNILYVCADPGIPVLGNKGASVHVREFTDALVGLGHRVMILSAAEDPPSSVSHNATLAELRNLPPTIETKTLAWRMATSLIRIGWPRDPAHLKSEMRHVISDTEFTEAAKVIARAFAPDLVIARHALFSVAGVEIARTLGCPCVLEVNAPLREERKRYWGLTLDDIAAQAERQVFAEADVIIAVSEGVRSYLLRNGANAEHVLVVPNGVDITRFHPAVDGRGIRAQLGIDDTTVTVGFAGSLKPWHGLDALVHTISELRRDNAMPPTRLIIVGEGPEREALGELCQRAEIAERVIFTGAVPHHQMPAYLAAFDIAVAPYAASDGFYFSPLKIMEYLAMGRPVIAPSLGQIPSLLAGDNGPCGLLYAPDDTPGLAAALRQLLCDADLRRELGARGAERVQRQFSWSVTAQRIVRRAGETRVTIF